MYRRIPLEPEQELLFRDLVEAEKRIPRSERQPFFILNTFGPPGVQLHHPGWTDGDRRIFDGDIEIFARAGLVAFTRLADHPAFYVTPQGFDYYAEMMRQIGKPLERLQAVTRDYIQNPGFQGRYPAAHEKWARAETLLWSSDSVEAFTTIGHLLREAMQDFASALVERFHPPNVEPNKAKIVARVRAVLALRKSSESVAAFLDALLAYWGRLSDLVQRQEHGALREGEALGWLDARRAVFQAANTMLEIDAALTS